MTALADNPDLLMAVTFVAVLLFMGALVFAFTEPGGGRVSKRLEHMKRRFQRQDTEEGERISVKRIAKEGWFKGFEVLARSLIPRPMELRARLAKPAGKFPWVIISPYVWRCSR